MSTIAPRFHRRRRFVLATSCWALSGLAVWAGRSAAEGDVAAQGQLFAPADAAQLNPAPVAAATPVGNVVINLINRLVDRGLLPKEDAADLIRQAEADAQRQREEQEVTVGAINQTAAMAQQAAQVAAAAAAPPPTEDAMRVTYVPEIVKAQLRDQIKAELAAEGQKGLLPNRPMAPEWTARIRVFGDVRLRSEYITYPSGNDNTGAFPNFNAINTGQPFDTSGTVFSPQINADQNRYRLRLRVRAGLEANLSDGFSAGIRIATGDNNTPVSVNQTLGLASQGQGGNFSKYALWLDRAFLKYEAGGLPGRNLEVLAGRFENPFFAPSELVWDQDLGFDGLAVSGKYQLASWFTPFIHGGAFPIFNTDLNFSTNRPAKFKSTDKWLYGGQFGFDAKPAKDFVARLAGAYYYFDGVEGRLSDPFTPIDINDQGNTDNTRPSFAQKGNTYMALRDIVASAINDFGTRNQFQYFGLATPFQELVFNGKVDYSGFEPVQVSVFGEYAKNLAFDRRAIEAKAVNNRGPVGKDGQPAKFEGGDTAWLAGVRVGRGVMDKRGDWNLGLNYRYVESDAVVDGFNESVFGLGGTNMKGYTLFGNVALSSAVQLGARWMSANEIAGPPFKSDILIIDLGGRF